MRKALVDCPFEIKAVTEDGRIEGMGAVFGNVDLGWDRIERGAFRDWLSENNGKSVPMLWQHNAAEPIGVWDDIAETRKGLFVGGKISDTALGRDARTLALDGAVTGLSIGYYPVDFKIEKDVRVLTKLDVIETSMVTFPMNPEARVSGVKNLTNKEFVRYAQDTWGISREAAEALRARGLSGLREKAGILQEDDGDDVTLIEGSDVNLDETMNRIRSILT